MTVWGKTRGKQAKTAVISLLQTEEGEQRKSKRRKASHGTRSIPTLRGQCGVGVATTSPVDPFQSWMTFKREKTIPSSSFFLKLWAIITVNWVIFLYIYLFFDHLSNFVIKNQSRAISKRKMGELSSPPVPSDALWWESFPSNNCNSSHQNPSEHDSHQKRGIFPSAKISFSHIYEKILALFDLMGCVWHEAFLFDCLWWFDDFHCRVLQCSHGKPSRTLWEGLLHTLLFFRVLYSIPRACQMDSLWSVRILSPPSYLLEADKTGGSASTSDWPESCFSKLQCRGCLVLTSNELDIYTFHTDKSSIWKACTHIG